MSRFTTSSTSVLLGLLLTSPVLAEEKPATTSKSTVGNFAQQVKAAAGVTDEAPAPAAPQEATAETTPATSQEATSATGEATPLPLPAPTETAAAPAVDAAPAKELAKPKNVLSLPEGAALLGSGEVVNSTDTSATSARTEEAKTAEPAVPDAALLASKSPTETKLAAGDSATAQLIAAPQGTAEGDSGLRSVLAYVHANHPQLKAKREELKVIDEGVAQAASGFRPTVTADLAKTRSRSENAASNWDYRNSGTRGLNVTQQLFNGGETLASLATAKDRVKAGRASLVALEQQLFYDTVVAYTDVVEKQLVLELSQQNVDVLKKQLGATQARFDVGELTVTDVAQSTARLASAEAAERQALGDLEASKATFKRTIGYDMPAKVEMPTVPTQLPATLADANTLAQAANPILEAARYNERAAGNNVYVQGSSLLPDVSLQGSIERGSGSNALGVNRDSDALTVNLSIPLYQSGAEWSRLRAARNQAQQAKFTLFDTQASVTENVTRAWEDYQTASALITSNSSVVKAAETALEGVRRENEFGVRTVLDVLDAEQETFGARVNLVRAVRNEKLQAYRLLGAVGKLTARDLSLQTDVPSPQEHYDSVKYQLLGL
jgi:outer membrane protein